MNIGVSIVLIQENNIADISYFLIFTKKNNNLRYVCLKLL